MAVDTSDTVHDAEGARCESSASFVSSVVLSYAAAALILAWLINYVGVWQILAGTRFLDILISIGAVQYHDVVATSPFKLPDPSFYFETQLPIDWRIVIVAILIFAGFSIIKAFQYSSIARAYGVKGSTGQHVRAYLYGDGIDRFMPFYIGSVGTAAALANQGARFDRALSSMVISHSLMIFEVAVFATVALFFLGWSDWLSELLWACAFLGVVYFLMRPGRDSSDSLFADGRFSSIGRRTFSAGAQAFLVLVREKPALLVKLCLLSIVAFWLLDFAIYLIVEAFNDEQRSYTVELPLLVMGIVGGYIARLIPVTPGGIGQWEFGFSAGFLIYGGDVSFNLLFAAILANLLRGFTGFLLMSTVLVFFGVPTNLRSVIKIFRGAEPPPGPA